MESHVKGRVTVFQVASKDNNSASPGEKRKEDEGTAAAAVALQRQNSMPPSANAPSVLQPAHLVSITTLSRNSSSAATIPSSSSLQSR